LNCFTPVCWAVLVRLNGGNRLVSTYGAKLAEPPAGAPGELGAGDGDVDGGDVDGGALGADEVGVGAGEDGGAGVLGTGLLVGAGPLVGDGSPAWQEAPSIRQADGFPAWPAAAVTNPTGCELPGGMLASQPAARTVTVPSLTVDEPFHRLDSRVPVGSLKDRVHPDVAEVPWLVIVYWPV
jgi:hypothetical protein